MKKKCKDIDITNQETIKPWVFDCIHRHYHRYDFKRFLLEHGLSKEAYDTVLKTHDYRLFDEAIDRITNECVEAIKQCKIKITPPSLTERADKTTGKIRLITCETPLHQIFDFIAVYGAMPVFKSRLVPEQASGMVGRGQVYGVKLIQKIVRKDNAAIEYAKRHDIRYHSKCKYFAKLDIEKCFPSMRKDIFMNLFRHDCGNDDLIWLFRCAS